VTFPEDPGFGQAPQGYRGVGRVAAGEGMEKAEQIHRAEGVGGCGLPREGAPAQRELDQFCRGHPLDGRDRHGQQGRAGQEGGGPGGMDRLPAGQSRQEVQGHPKSTQVGCVGVSGQDLHGPDGSRQKGPESPARAQQHLHTGQRGWQPGDHLQQVHVLEAQDHDGAQTPGQGREGRRLRAQSVAAGQSIAPQESHGQRGEQGVVGGQRQGKGQEEGQGRGVEQARLTLGQQGVAVTQQGGPVGEASLPQGLCSQSAAGDVHLQEIRARVVRTVEDP